MVICYAAAAWIYIFRERSKVSKYAALFVANLSERVSFLA